MRSWRCSDCGGEGMYQTSAGMRICDCEAGMSRREYLGMREEERRRGLRGARRRKRKKDAPLEEAPF